MNYHSIYETELEQLRKPEKNPGLNGIRNAYEICDAGVQCSNN